MSQSLKFLVVIFVARRFSTSEFGLFSFAIAANAYILVISHFGLPFFGSRAVANSGRVSKGLLAEVFCLRAVLALAAILAVVGALTLSTRVSRQELFLVGILGISNIPLAGLFDWVFQGLHQQAASAILNIIWQGSWLLLTVAGIHLGIGIVAVPTALCGAALIATTAGYVWLRSTGHINSLPTTKLRLIEGSWKTLKAAAPLGWGILLITVLVWSDVIIVRLVGGERMAAWYAAGNRAALALAMLSSFYVQAALPLLSRTATTDRVQFGRLFQHCYEDLALVFIPVSLWAFVYAPEIVILLFARADYMAAVPVFRIFQLVFLVTTIATLYGIGGLVACHHDKDYRRTLIVVTILFIPLCSILAWYAQIVGASLAVLLTQVFSLFLFAKVIRNSVRPRHSAALLFPICCGLALVAVSKLAGLTLAGSAVLTILTYVVLLWGRLRRTQQATPDAHQLSPIGK